MHRKILDSDIWNDPTTFRLFMFLIMKATHSGTVINGYELEQGQYIRSYRKLVEDLAYKEGRGLKEPSINTIKKCIDKLVKQQRIAVLGTEVGTLFTILNYASYQQPEDIESQSVNSSVNELGTNGERMVNKSKNAKNAKNAQESNSTLRSKLKFETHHMKLAELFFKKIQENNPNAKQPNLESWASVFRLMMERDKRDGKEVQEMILYCQQHHFWFKNILSPDKLRKQFDRLQMEMKDDEGLKVIKGGAKNAESSFENDYSKYDFSKRRNLRGLPEEN